jgi:hypothetical protein
VADPTGEADKRIPGGLRLPVLEEHRGDVDQAIAGLRKAEARDSEDWRLPLIEARLQLTRGEGPQPGWRWTGFVA